MPQRLGDVCLADPDGAEQNYGLSGVEPAQGGQVADLGCGEFRGGGEVELLQGDLLLELRPEQAALERDGVPSGDLVLAERLEEFQVSEFAAVGLGQAGVQGFQHARELQRAERVAQGGVHDAHHATPSS
jgi:hypothetical protein